MFDYSILPASSAEEIIEPLLINGDIKYSFMESTNEGKLYEDLNERLTILEVSLTIDIEALHAIIEDTKGFRLLIGEKEEVLIRTSWLERLKQVQQELVDVQTKGDAQKLMGLISTCQTSPLKSQLVSQLDQLSKSLPSKESESVQITDAEILMEKAVEEAGDTFINLGTAGRASVITDVLKQFGEKSTVEAVQKHTTALEQRVEALTSTTEANELIKQLDSLPIPFFDALPAERKARIAETLIENNKWSGLASLNRMIAHLDKAITNEEQQREESKNTLLTSGGKAALTLDIKNVEDGRVQLG